MRVLAFISLFSILFAIKADEFVLQDNLYQLDASNYDRFIAQYPNSVIMLNTNTDCHICEDAYKTHMEVSAEYNKEGSATKLGVVKCQNSSSLCRRLSSKKSPVLFMSIRGEHVYFGEMYSKRNVSEFISQRLRFKVKDFNPATFDSEKSASNVELKAIVLVKEHAKQTTLDIFHDLARYELEDVFMVCKQEKCMKYFGPDADVVYLLNNKRKAFRMDQVPDFHHLINEFFAFKHPFVIDFETEFKKRVVDEMTPTLVYITDKVEDDEDRGVFEKAIEKFDKNMLACIVEVNNLSPEAKKLYAELIDTLDLEGISYPLITYLEPDLETLTLSQYRYNNTLELLLLKEFISSLFNGQAIKYIKYEKKHPAFEKNLPVLNALTFKNNIFINDKESVVLVHRGFDKCDVSRRYLDHVAMLSKENEFKSLFFAVINGVKNELPTYIEKLPAILVFTKNSWDYPIVFTDSPSNINKFNKLLKDRKKVVFSMSDGEDLKMFGEL